MSKIKFCAKEDVKKAMRFTGRNQAELKKFCSGVSENVKGELFFEGQKIMRYDYIIFNGYGLGDDYEHFATDSFKEYFCEVK